MFNYLLESDTYYMLIIKEEKAETKSCLFIVDDELDYPHNIDYLKKIYNPYSLTFVDMG